MVKKIIKPKIVKPKPEEPIKKNIFIVRFD